MSEDREAVLARLQKARESRLGPGDEHRWECPLIGEDSVRHNGITLYISSQEVYCKCGRRMKEVQ